jgi:hypothetical protein
VPLRDPDFWQTNATVVSIYLGYFLLGFYAAAAQITFASDNRSTRLRITMLGLYLLVAGWMCRAYFGQPGGATLEFFILIAALHWYFMGALMTGESPELSPRVKRGLPQSFLGRVFLTWFNPGPGTGYMFALSSMLAASLMAVGMILTQFWLELWPASRPWPYEGTAAVALLATCYVTAYLGTGLLLIRFLRRFSYCPVFAALAIQVLLLLLGVGIPLIVQGLTPQWRNDGYSLLHMTNPFWSCRHALSFPIEAPVLLSVVSVAALIVFLLNLPAIAREVRHVRIDQPRRVADEDAQLLAAKHPPQPVHISPWD